MDDVGQHERAARAREIGAAACAVLAVVPALFAPNHRLAWAGVTLALLATAATLGFLLTGSAARARTTVSLTFLALVGAQLAHSQMVLVDLHGLVYRAVLLVGLPLPALIGAFVLATSAADARRRAWGRRYQQKVGYDPERPSPTIDWG